MILIYNFIIYPTYTVVPFSFSMIVKDVNSITQYYIILFFLFSIFLSSFCAPLYLAFKTNSFEMSTTDIEYRNTHLVYNIITGTIVMSNEVYYNFIFFPWFHMDFLSFWLFFFKIRSYENENKFVLHNWQPMVTINLTCLQL